MVEANCKACGSTVTDTDRFCPACGTPNAFCKFHPKFGPGLKIFEPRILSELAPAGSPSCPRCHRAIDRPDEYCSACGMGLEEAWARLDRVTVLNAWRRDKGEIPPYRRPVWLVTPLLAILTVGILATAGIGLVNLWLYFWGDASIAGGPASSPLVHGLDIVTAIAMALFAVGAVLTIAAIWLMYRNLPALEVGDERFGSGWAVWGWFVPGLNLIRPKQVVDDLWRASHPYAPPFSASWRVGPVPSWSAIWWITAWLGAGFALLSHLVAPAAGTVNSADLQASLALAGAAGLMLALSAVCLQLLVRNLAERQELRATIVAERQGAPSAPTRDVESSGTLLRPVAADRSVHGKY